MFQANPLESSWDVTSDSIAAYVACKLQAPKAIFVTDVDGVYSADPRLHKNERLLNEVSVQELQTFGGRTSVDRYLPKFLLKSPLDCYVLNGNFPERIAAVLEGKPTTCTRIVANR
jgi:aspartokinase-like uncharacterized kinase